MPADIATELESLKTGLAGMEASLKSLAAPDLSGVRKDEQGRTTGYIEETDEEVSLRWDETDSRAVSRKSYKAAKKESVRQLKAAGYVPRGEFKTFNEFVRDGLNSGNSESFNSRVAKHYGSAYKAIQGMNETAGAEGGILVMPEFSSGMIDSVYQNDLWSRTDNYTVSGNSMTFQGNAETSRANGSRHGGLRGYWGAEGNTMTKSTPTVREVSLRLCKVYVVVYLTDELIADTSALQTYVTRKAGEEFNFLIGDALINGTGAGQPLGLLNSPALVSQAKETGQVAATIVSENVVNMYKRFRAANLNNAAWFYNQDIFAQLQLLNMAVGTGGSLVYQPPGGLSAAPYGSLMGRPMVPTEFNATLGTQGDLMLADLSQVLSISKGGMEQAVSMHVEFLSGQTALRFSMRLNARPWLTAPITPFKGSATQSPFVALDTRA